MLALFASVVLHLVVIYGWPMGHHSSRSLNHLIRTHLTSDSEADMVINASKTVTKKQDGLQVRLSDRSKRNKDKKAFEKKSETSAVQKSSSENLGHLPAPYMPPINVSIPQAYARFGNWLAGMDFPLVSDPTFYPAKQVDQYARALTPINPVFPLNADKESIARGEVRLLVLVDEEGAVVEVSVIDSKPAGYFEESAVEAFQKAIFYPAIRNGRFVKSRMLIVVNYGEKPSAEIVEQQPVVKLR